MNPSITAADLWPIIQKLSTEELVRLARLAMRAAVLTGGDAEAYRAAPPSEAEFGSDEDALAWEGSGWEEFYAPR